MTSEEWEALWGAIKIVGGFLAFVFVVWLIGAIHDAHEVYDNLPPTENYAFFLSECGKSGFDERQCAFLGRVGRITGRPPIEEKGERL
jgi:hypothetical protein